MLQSHLYRCLGTSHPQRTKSEGTTLRSHRPSHHSFPFVTFTGTLSPDRNCCTAHNSHAWHSPGYKPRGITSSLVSEQPVGCWPPGREPEEGQNKLVPSSLCACVGLCTPSFPTVLPLECGNYPTATAAGKGNPATSHFESSVNWQSGGNLSPPHSKLEMVFILRVLCVYTGTS